MTDPQDPTTPKPPSDDQLDIESEQERLEALETEDDRIRARADEDLEVGGAGRTFADRGVREQVADRGDTDRPPADGA